MKQAKGFLRGPEGLEGSNSDMPPGPARNDSARGRVLPS